MNKQTLFLKLFTRYLKEQKLYGIFQKIKFNLTNNTPINVIDSVCQFLNSIHIYSHYKRRPYSMEFMKIVSIAYKQYCISFLEERNLLTIFAMRLYYSQSPIIPNLYFPKYNNLNDRVIMHKIVYSYFHCLLAHNYSIFDFICYAFCWEKTPERHKFWQEIHISFHSYLEKKIKDI